ncbi:conserved hypothetical protein [Ricinus communis]|uniref:Uncharacterized protein n=1 Tax=Ricinus communis TaxID=3988 RepID=B9S877_RICCO|nr:conserved hypothetical protein [Ricinus communis]
MSIADNTRAQEIKRLKEDIKNMHEQALTEMMNKQQNLILDELKTLIISMHLRGQGPYASSPWHQSYLKNRDREEEPQWKEYMEALKGRVEERGYEDPMKDLKGLLQTSSLQQAYALAQMQESYLTTTRTSKSYYNKPPSPATSTPTTNQNKPLLLATSFNVPRFNNSTTTPSNPDFRNPTTNSTKPYKPRTMWLTDAEINEKGQRICVFGVMRSLL